MRRPVVRKPRPTSQPFALHGLVVCALCHRRMQGSANRGRAHYRCRYPSEYAMANELDHPRNVYVREDQLLGPLDGWLAQVFDPGQLDTTLDALEAAASSTDDAGQAKTQAARRRVAECDTRLARYRAALEAGTDPVVVSAWIAEVQAERLAAEVELGRATGQRSRRLSRDQLAALVNGLGNLLDVLASAAPEDKAEVYRRLGLQLTYDPARRVVTVESHLGPDDGRELSGGRRPGGGSGPGAPGTEPVGESQCRRGDTRANPTLGADRRADHRSRLTCKFLAKPATKCLDSLTSRRVSAATFADEWSVRCANLTRRRPPGVAEHAPGSPPSRRWILHRGQQLLGQSSRAAGTPASTHRVPPPGGAGSPTAGSLPM